MQQPRFLFTVIFFLYSLIFRTPLSAQPEEDFSYFPPDISYDPSFPTPESILGYEVGEWHVSHDQLVYYMKEMARLSDRITIEETGRTYENRPLLLLTITSPENHGRIEEIRTAHLALSDPSTSANIDINDMPVVVWLGHSVHGNEPSGGNASLLTVYHWAAAQGSAIDDILKNTIILIDPCINPDGFHRFSSWVNSNRGANPSPDPNDREHNEAWPRGRTNHYWFDLNRDWLPLQHPESKARMAKYHQWKPNILTDHHEMGTNSTFFFTPGIPSRNHPLIPQNTITLSEKIGEYHARELDRIGSLYYSQENYDNFYFGKGSTYPDFNGAVGLLFEQASARGHIQNTDNGVLTFPFAIRNQFTAAYSTVLAGHGLRTELLEHQKSFYLNAQNEVRSSSLKGYIWSAGEDQSRSQYLIELLTRQQLDVYRLASDQRIAGKQFQASNSYFIPADQTNFKMLQILFETRTSFKDSLFYDVSAWTIPLSMGVEYAPVTGRVTATSLQGDKMDGPEWPRGTVERSSYAYALRWDDYHAPEALNILLEEGLIAKVATEPFTSGGESYGRGTVIIPIVSQSHSADETFRVLTKAADQSGVSFSSIPSGYTGGVNLGSRTLRPLRELNVALLTGSGVRSYNAGEVWHLLDYRMNMNVTLLPVDRFDRTDLSKYNTIVMSDGNYSNLNGEKLKSWVDQGGVLVAEGRAGKWLSDKKITATTYKSSKPGNNGPRAYGHESKHRGAQLIGGAIFNTRGDLSHPLLFGIGRSDIPVFRRGKLFMELSKGVYANPLIYTNRPLLAGYISDGDHRELGGTASIEVSAIGRGRVITLTDNPNFRAFWFGTNKIFLNALFFGHIIRESSTR